MVRIEPRTPRISRRGLGSAFVLLLAAVILGSCSSNSALDSHAAQQKDATKGAVLPGLAATKTIKDFFPHTPTPLPTMTPMAAIASLRLATSVDNTGAPTNTTSSASPGQQVYAAAQLSHLYAGETVAALWFNSDGTLLAEVDQKVTSDMDNANVALAWTVASGTFGTCWVEIWVGTVFDKNGKMVTDSSVTLANTKMNSIVFSCG